MKRLSYEPTKTLLLMTGGWVLVGAIPRLVGIAVPKPQYVRSLWIADSCICIVFGLAALYIGFALVYNAKQRQKAHE